MVWWHILWWAAFAFGGSCCFAAAVEYHPMLYCVQCCCCRVHFVYNQSTEYTETICMHFICTNLLRHTICALYLCKVCSAQRIRIVDFSAHVALFVCVSYSATSRLCLERWPSPAWERWASSALARFSDPLAFGSGSGLPKVGWGTWHHPHPLFRAAALWGNFETIRPPTLPGQQSYQ